MGNARMKDSDKLPDTLTPLSLTQEQKEIRLPWGRLYSCLEKFKSVDLVDDIITLGRGEENTIVVYRENYPENTMLNISRLHFTLIRDEYTNLVYLKDNSKNGTFVNGNIVGKGNKNILQHDDILSVGFKGTQKLFIFKLLDSDESNKYLPPELRKKYKLSRFLGKGACGEVHLLFDKITTKAYAVKKIRKGIYSSDNIHHLDHPIKIMNEVQILKSLAHPCIIKLTDIVETERDVFLILEYMGGGELTKRILSIQPMTEQNIKFIFYQIALAVKYLHEEGITHRDLKPDNVLLANDSSETLVKITDFGLSKFLNEYTMMETICGTPTYVAPEVIDGTYSEYSKKVDIWSLGVILFYMLCKELPFRSPERAKLNSMIINGQYKMDSEKWTLVSSLATNLVRKMLVVDPQERFNIEQVLLHPWISEDIQMHQRVAEVIKHGTYDHDYFIDNTENEEPGDAPPVKKIKLFETIV